LTRFSELLARSGLSDADAARLLGVSRQTISDLKEGVARPTPRHIQVLVGLNLGKVQPGRNESAAIAWSLLRVRQL
jgi:transcriptional regulator with XRE-family HTH domain